MIYKFFETYIIDSEYSPSCDLFCVHIASQSDIFKSLVYTTAGKEEKLLMESCVRIYSRLDAVVISN